jgi:hypothetical protein
MFGIYLLEIFGIYLLETTMLNQITSTNDYAEVLSHIINCTSLEQFEEAEIRLRRFLHSHSFKCMTFYPIRKNM